MKRRVYILFFLFFLIIIFFISVDIFLKKSRNEMLIIGVKNEPESFILANMIAALVEKNSTLSVLIKNLDGTFLNFHSIKSGDIDLYIEYTGTALMAILKEGSSFDEARDFEFVKKEFFSRFGIVWLKPFGFSNDYVLLMSKKKAGRLGIEKISDLKDKKLVFGFDPEFVARDEFKALKSRYGVKKKVKIMEHSLLYLSILNGGVDVIDGYTMDPGIIRYNMKALIDDKKVFPSYLAAPIVRESFIKKHTYIREIVERLSGKVSNEDILKMNYEMEYNGKKPSDLAYDFLYRSGILVED